MRQGEARMIFHVKCSRHVNSTLINTDPDVCQGGICRKENTTKSLGHCGGWKESGWTTSLALPLFLALFRSLSRSLQLAHCVRDWSSSLLIVSCLLDLQVEDETADEKIEGIARRVKGTKAR